MIGKKLWRYYFGDVLDTRHIKEMSGGASAKETHFRKNFDMHVNIIPFVLMKIIFGQKMRYLGLAWKAGILLAYIIGKGFNQGLDLPTFWPFLR